MGTNFYASPTWNDLRDRVLVRDNKTCQYCGAVASQVDHISPRHYSLDDDESNLVAVCRSCNKWFGGKTFRSFEEKLAYYKKNNLDVWQEYLERIKKRESLLGRPLNEEDKRKGRIAMIAEGKMPIAPSTRAFDHRCVTCLDTASAQEASKKGWPNTSMCPACAKEAGVALNFQKRPVVRKIDKYEEFVAKEDDPENRKRLELLIREEKAKAGKTDPEKLLWNIENADQIEEGMIYRRVCRECGWKIEDYEYRDGLPYCKDGKHGKESTYLAPNVDWFIDEPIEKKPVWHKPTPQEKKKQIETRPDSFLMEEIVKDTKTREERRAWNKEHAEWLELSMSSYRVCRCCGRKTNYYDLIEGIVTCVGCQRTMKQGG